MANSVVRSMTGFAQKSYEIDGFNVVITLKSVNGKGLDISFKAPPEISSLESFIKDSIKHHVKRGTITIYIDLKQNSFVNIDLKQIKNILKELKDFTKELDINISDDKLFDLAIEAYSKLEPIKDEIVEKIKPFFEDTLKEFLASKEKEGIFLIEDIKTRIGLLETYLRNAIDTFKNYETKAKDRLIQKAKELTISESNPTLVNELMLLLGRLDISEELSRIQTHINHMFDIINSKELEKGKKIDFLSQELQRETTTMSNKVPELSEIAINMKYEIDKIKQQCANLE